MAQIAVATSIPSNALLQTQVGGVTLDGDVVFAARRVVTLNLTFRHAQQADYTLALGSSLMSVDGITFVDFGRVGVLTVTISQSQRFAQPTTFPLSIVNVLCQNLTTNLSVSVTARPAASLDSALGSVGTGTTALVTLGTALSNPSGAVTASKLNGALSLRDCDFDNTAPLAFSQSPTGFAFGPEEGQYYRGAVIGNLGIMLGVMAAAFGAAAFVWKMKSRGNRGDHKDFKFVHALYLLHVPGIFVVPFSVVCDGLASGSTSSIVHASSWSDYCVGALGYTFLLVSLGYFVYFVRSFGCELIPRGMSAIMKEKLEEGGEASQTGEEQLVSDEWKMDGSCYSRTFESSMKWKDKAGHYGFKDLHQKMFGDQRIYYYTPVEITVTVMFSIVEGIRIENSGSCITSMFLMAGLWSAFFIFIVVMRPSMILSDAVFLYIGNLVGVVTTWLIVAAGLTDNDVFIQGSSISTLIGLGVSMLKVTIDCMVVLAWVWRYRHVGMDKIQHRFMAFTKRNEEMAMVSHSQTKNFLIDLGEDAAHELENVEAEREDDVLQSLQSKPIDVASALRNNIAHLLNGIPPPPPPRTASVVPSKKSNDEAELGDDLDLFADDASEDPFADIDDADNNLVEPLVEVDMEDIDPFAFGDADEILGVIEEEDKHEALQHLASMSLVSPTLRASDNPPEVLRSEIARLLSVSEIPAEDIVDAFLSNSSSPSSSSSDDSSSASSSSSSNHNKSSKLRNALAQLLEGNIDATSSTNSSPSSSDTFSDDLLPPPPPPPPPPLSLSSSEDEFEL